MTNIVPSVPADSGDLKGVLANLSSRKAVAEPEKPVEPQTLVSVSQEAKAALVALSGQLSSFEPPKEAVLTEQEQFSLMLLMRDVKTGAKTLKTAEAAVKEAVFTHFDARLEEDNDPASMQRDSSGHYLVECSVDIPTLGKRFTRQVRESDPDLSAEALLGLYELGVITRSEYLAATKETPREIDEKGLLALLKNRTDIHVAVSEVLTPGKKIAALMIQDIK